MKTLIASVLIGLAPVAATATAIQEKPWAPRAAAYGLTLFMGNLAPVPWDKIENSWTKPAPGAALPVDALSRMTAGEADAVRAALAAKDRQALFAASTTAIASGVLRELDQAAATLGKPEARVHMAQAGALYRSFDVAIRAADPKAAKQIGLAWLKMNSAMGSAGVLGRAVQAAEVEAFSFAAVIVADYINVNYLPRVFSERRKLTAIPETVAATGRRVDLPVTLPPGSFIGQQTPLPRLVLQFEEAGEDEANLPLVAYGDMLFDSPEIFGGPAKALNITCSTCHNRSDVNRDFFIPGLSTHAGGMDVDGAFFNPLFNDRTDDALDTPSMRGIRFTAPYGRDGREPSLRRFIRNVIVTEFAGKEPTPFQLDALEAYVKQFDFLPNPKIDREGGLTDLASEAAKRGEQLFNTEYAGLGGKSCASCHTPERHFRDGLTHDIGTHTPAVTNTPTSFETPTLRNVNFTAPYMHDGSLPTLASVVNWFNDSKALGLSAAEAADLTAYVKAVGDGEEPYQHFDGRDSVFRLSWDEITTFATTLDTLIPLQDAPAIAVLINTIAPDLSADASAMVNQSAKHRVYQLSGLLRDVGMAAEAGEWAKADEAWTAFKVTSAAYDEEMF